MMTKRLTRTMFLAVLASIVSACGGNRMDVFLPYGTTVPGATPLKILVATTRQRAENPADLFSGERGQKLSLADISISIPPDANRQQGEVQWPKNVPGDAKTDFVVLGTEFLDEKTIKDRLRQRLKANKNGNVLLFVHGYNNRFADAVFRFAQIAHDSQAPVVPVLFTWPSRARALAYAYDRESANFSRDALELTIRTLQAEPSVKEINVMAHSMGTWVTLESLRQIAIRDSRLPSKITNVIIAAPDVDVDVFGMQIARMGTHRPRFSLFASQDDKALAFSRRIGGDVPRLGAIDTTQEPLRSQLAAQGVEVFDITKLSSGDSYNHGKFAQSAPVVQFIGRRLIAGQAVGDNDTSLADHISTLASRAGAVAGMIVTAPLAAVDPTSRRSFGAQLNDALGNVERREHIEQQPLRVEITSGN